MNRTTIRLLGFALLCVAAPAAARAQTQACPLRFKITVETSASSGPVSGRLLVFMTNRKEDRKVLGVSFVPDDTWVAAEEIESIAPGQSITFDPDLRAFPKPFSQAPAGDYQFMALLDPDHSYPYTEQDADDLYGPVVKVRNLNPASTEPVEMAIDRRSESSFKPADTASVKLVEFQSPILSKFWGRPIMIQAGVVLPPSFATHPEKTYPAVYNIHGFGGDHTTGWRVGPALVKDMADGKQMEMVYVFLNGHCPTGHHEFADSINNGPWGEALTTEFIPYLETKFRLISKPYARFLTGHSSGGWSSLWLQVTYPDFFGGTWSTSPDPVDLRSFTGVNVTPGSKDNMYTTADGKPRNLVRMNGAQIASIEQFARMESVTGDYGGQFASFEWVWSPKGQDGRPLKLFNRDTGELNPETMKAWQKYDIRLILDRNWDTLGPKLKGKIDVICGEQDTFHLDEAVKMLCAFFKEKQADAVCELIPGRDHFNLYRAGPRYPNGLGVRILNEMAHKFAEGAAADKAAGAPGR